MSRLFLGTAREIITPKIGARLYGYAPDIYSESVNDDLTLTAFAFSDGETKALMVSATVGNIQTSLAEELRKEAEKTANVSYKNIIISATHTHTGPTLTSTAGWGDIDEEYYNGIFKPAFLKAVEDAFNNMQEVKVGIASGKSEVGINRRQINKDNAVILGQCPWGVYNPEMTIISFKNSSGEVVANMIHYGCHGTSAGIISAISRDWEGVMCDSLEKHSGGMTAFFNGPEGDVGPRISNGKTAGHDIKYIYELGEKAAEDAISIFSKIEEYKEVCLKAKSGAIKLKLSKREALSVAKEKIGEFNASKGNIFMLGYEHFKSVIESYESDFVEEEYKELEQSVIKIGEAVFVSFPYELFSEIGMRINELSEGRILSLSNANGTEGYFPTEKELCRGGYEVNSFKYSGVQTFTDDADYQIIKETLKNLEDMK